MLYNLFGISIDRVGCLGRPPRPLVRLVHHFALKQFEILFEKNEEKCEKKSHETMCMGLIGTYKLHLTEENEGTN